MVLTDVPVIGTFCRNRSSAKRFYTSPQNLPAHGGAYVPLVTLSGIVTEIKLLLLAKAEVPMLVTL